MGTDAQSVASGPEAGKAWLLAAARAGGFAPSIHNTQPWRWVVGAPTLELRAVRDRQLVVADPMGRMLTLSCGAALQHARVALAAEGWQFTVERLPDEDDPDLLARITLTAHRPVTPAAIRLMQTLRIRHTDRRPVSARPVQRSIVDNLARVADGEGAHLHVLRPDDVMALAAAASRAQHVEDLDPQMGEELRYWAGTNHDPGLGLTEEVLPSAPPQTTVPGRDFGRAGTLPVGEGHDNAAVYAILYGDEDVELGWLRAGEALSAIWLEAIERSLSVLPLSAAVEVAATRQILRELLAELGEPLLVLRLGVADDEHAGVPHTPRLPAEQTIADR